MPSQINALETINKLNPKIEIQTVTTGGGGGTGGSSDYTGNDIWGCGGADMSPETIRIDNMGETRNGPKEFPSQNA